MHELSIATAILETVETEAKRRPGAHFTKVGVRVGELSGVNPDSLSFGWEALTKDTPWEPVRLDIQNCPQKQLCSCCGNTFTVHNFVTVCPRCEETDTECVSGNELDIAYLELEEA